MPLGASHPLRNESTRDTRYRSALRLLTGAGFPIAWAALGVVSPSLLHDYGAVVLLAWVFLGVINAAVWLNAEPVPDGLVQLTIDNMDLAEERDDLEKRLRLAERWVLHSFIAFNLRAMTTSYIQVGVANLGQLKEALSEMLAPLYLTGGETLGFEASERWAVAVYFYSGERDQLQLVWREKSRNHPAGDNPRSWGRGQGHVGKAFVDGKPIITADASHPDVEQLCVAPAGHERNYDQKAYRSFASIPISVSEAEHQPYGVLVGTSDKPGRFDQDSALLLKHFADSIGMLMAIARIDFDGIRGEAE